MEGSSKILAFIGHEGSGKNTAANEIYQMIEKSNKPTVTSEFAFANPLKMIANTSLNITMDQSEFLKRNPNIKVANNLDIREYYNTLGDVLKRNFGDDIFRDRTIISMQELIDTLESITYIITDVRYPQEVDALKIFAAKNNIPLYFIKMVKTGDVININLDAHESVINIDKLDYDFLVDAKNPEEIKIKMEIILNELY